MNKWTEILLGLVFLVAAILLWTYNLVGFGTAAVEFLKGGVIWLIIFIGILLIILGISDLKE